MQAPPVSKKALDSGTVDPRRWGLMWLTSDQRPGLLGRVGVPGDGAVLTVP